MKAESGNTFIKLRQMIGFLASGGTATAVHWTAMWLLLQQGASALFATAAGSVAGAAANYGLQRRLAFRNAGDHKRSLPRYALSCSIAWMTNLALFNALHAVAGLDVALAQFITTVLVTGLNYVMYERLVFHG